MTKVIFTFFNLILFWTNFCWAGEPNWTALARNLNNEEKQQEAIAQLQRLPRLELNLTKALDEPDQQSLAFQVIKSLNLRNLAPALTDHLQKDPQGRFLDTLLFLKARNPELKNNSALNDLWKKSNFLTTDQKIIFLTSTSSDEFPLTSELFKKWISDKDPDLKIALAKRTVRDGKKGLPNESWWPLLLQSNPYQVRWEAIAGAAGLKALTPKTVKSIKDHCQKEIRDEVKGACSLFLERNQ
jgi:hypothetical protein